MNTAIQSLPLEAVAQASSPAATGLRRWFAEAGDAIWRALEASGRARAQRHLLAFADRCEAQQPELAKELRIAAGQGPLV